MAEENFCDLGGSEEEGETHERGDRRGDSAIAIRQAGMGRDWALLSPILLVESVRYALKLRSVPKQIGSGLYRPYLGVQERFGCSLYIFWTFL